jgi:hypothetical protein
MNALKVRSCKHCGESKHMRKLVDAEYGIFSERYWTCFQCHPELDSSAINNSGQSGGLKAMRSEDDGMGDVYCDSFDKDLDEEAQEKYADEDTELELEDDTVENFQGGENHG